jgi:predicted permease
MQASMPVAVVTLIFASEFGLDDKLVSGTILTTTLLSPLTLSVLILLLRQTLATGIP